VENIFLKKCKKNAKKKKIAGNSFAGKTLIYFVGKYVKT
jgi:hypothetical protein